MELLCFLVVVLLVNNLSSNTVEALRAEKIIDGYLAKRNTVKYVGALMYDPQDARLPEQHPCAVTILNDFYITTIAHCFFDRNTGAIINKPFFIAVGINDLWKNDEGTQYVKIKFVIFPRYYDPTTVDTYAKHGNIAVARLAEKLGLHQGHRYLRKLRVPHYQYIKSSHTFTVSGYGWHWIGNATVKVDGVPRVVFGGTTDSKLRFAEADILNTLDCQDKVIRKPIAPGNICVRIKQEPDERKGICQGDSGAPLARNEFIIAMAIHAFPNCNENEMPGIYLNIPYYFEFINNALNHNITADMRLYKLKEDTPNVFKFEKIV